MRGLVTVLMVAFAAAPAAAREVAVLQGLDKVTARISTFDAPLDDVVRFGSLEITARFADVSVTITNFEDLARPRKG